MRIITGTAKGKRLKLPKGKDMRPTQDKVKGAIFNILGDAIIDAKVLDLYSGSGALGIEALSRGAASCVFVDKDIKCVEDNLRTTGFEGKIIKNDVKCAIEGLAGSNEKFNIVFADPPYEKGIAGNVLSRLLEGGILSDNCYVVIEHSKREIINREKLKEKRYGDTVVSVFMANGGIV